MATTESITRPGSQSFRVLLAVSHTVHAAALIFAELIKHFTTDGYNFSEEVPTEFLEMFHAFNAVRFLADGCGLNFACDPAEAELILELDGFLDQGGAPSAGDLDSPVDTGDCKTSARPARTYYLPKFGKPNSALSK